MGGPGACSGDGLKSGRRLRRRKEGAPSCENRSRAEQEAACEGNR